MGMFKKSTTLFRVLAILFIGAQTSFAQINQANSLKIKQFDASLVDQIVDSPQTEYLFQCTVKIPNPAFDGMTAPDEPIHLHIPFYIKAHKMPEYTHELLVTKVQADSMLAQLYHQQEFNPGFVKEHDRKNRLIHTWKPINNRGELQFKHLSIRLYPAHAKLIGEARMDIETYQYNGQDNLGGCDLLELQ